MNAHDQRMRSAVLERIQELYRQNYDELEEGGHWGSSVKTEEDKKYVALRCLRAGLFGSFRDLNNVPTLEELQEILEKC